MQVHLNNIQVKFVYQGNRVKVKVTGAKTLYTGVTKYDFTFVGDSPVTESHSRLYLLAFDPCRVTNNLL